MKRTFSSAFFSLALLSAVSVQSVPALALEVGDNAPRIDLLTVMPDGSEISDGITAKAPELKFTILEFSTTTCGFCTKNLPALSQLATDVKSTAATRIVMGDTNQDATRSYVKKYKSLIHFPVAMDSQRAAMKAYNVTGVPTTFVIDSEDKIIFKKLGYFSPEDVEKIKNIVK